MAMLNNQMVIFSGKSSIHGSFSIARVITGGYLDGFGPRNDKGKEGNGLFWCWLFFCDCLRVILLGHLEFPYGDCYTWLMSLGPGRGPHFGPRNKADSGVQLKHHILGYYWYILVSEGLGSPVFSG
jgi:hypothetical protein